MEVFNTEIKLMSTTIRHSELVDAFTGDLRPYNRRGELNYWSDTIALVYDENRLINVNEVPIAEANKISIQLTKLPYVEPDVIMFQTNAYINNFSGTRLAGVPDLIIEVWSEDNDAKHRDKKFAIYSSSELTEHWYIEQRSDIVKCYKGSNRLPDQHLQQILKTQSGIQFDLTDKITGDDSSWNDFQEYGYKG